MNSTECHISEATPAEMLSRYRNGELRMAHELMLRFRSSLVATARKYVSDRADIDDAIQDTWVAFVRFNGSIHDPECVGGWLRSTCARAALGIAMRHTRVVVSAVSFDIGAEAHDIDLDVDLDSRKKAVNRALDRLRADERTLIEALMADGRPSYETVSKATGRPVGSIGPSRKRILQKLVTDPAIIRLRTA